ncbi:MAG: TraB/GumN family protein, partial [Bacteroidota bacterium]
MKRQSYSFLFLGLLLPFFALGQIPPQEKGILWEISGNGLDKKSYLFGSVHLYDARLFEFGDSLLACLDACEAFASEVHIDSIVRRLGEQEAYTKTEPPTKKDSLSSKIEEIPPPPQGFKKRSWGFSRLPYKAGDNPAFLDAYLFGLARRYGKQLFGLEQSKRHLSYLEAPQFKKELDLDVLDPNFDFRQSAIEKLLALYLKTDFESLEDFFHKSEDSLMEFRNRDMLSSLQKIMPDYALFSVVGVAHLFGETGLLSLLRKQGYKVRNVSYGFDNSGETYAFKSKKVKPDWPVFSRKNQGYEISFPGQPFKTGKTFAQKLMRESYFYPDLTTGAHYFVNLSEPFGENENFAKMADSVNKR